MQASWYDVLKALYIILQFDILKKRINLSENSNIEIQNPKQYQNLNVQNSKQVLYGAIVFRFCH